MFQAGDHVTIRPEWQDKPNDLIYIIKEWNEDRGYITPINLTGMTIPPTSLVRTEMIQLTPTPQSATKTKAIEKLVRDGKVAVIYSPGYGAGWSTWNYENAEDFVFDKDVAQAILDGDQGKAKAIAKAKYPDAYISGQELVIVWLTQGEHFQIKEYDGHEQVVLLKDSKILTA